MEDRQIQQTILDILERLDSLDGLKPLFWQALNYDRENTPLSSRQWPEPAQQALAGEPILFASGGEDRAFHIVYCRMATEELRRGPQRLVVNQLLHDHRYALFVFSNKAQSVWHFLNIKYDEQTEKRRLVRRITIRKGDGLRTAVERLAMLDLRAINPDLFGLSPLLIQQHHDNAFDVEKVTKEFYSEIANWYFWARLHAQFPKDATVDADGKPSLPLIRLLTRLIFCWFLKEKRNPETGAGLIPDTLFDPRRIRDLLKDPSPESCSYYTAVLQNLFFATLSTEMDRPGEPPNRRWIEEGDGERSDDHMIHTVWRHARQLKDPTALENLLRGIPFLNGGLFECLDERVQKGKSPYTVEVRVDGFATDPKKQPKLPNVLFYGAPQAVDLSDTYGDSSRRRETVRPLLDILNRYNFTLTENTPFDQEVALDPELLGHVFENLLAAFNPETGTVARKATGSFYTPRIVVDWMVDQALLVYLKGVLPSATADDTAVKLKQLLSWNEDGPDFGPGEVERLIDAVDGLKAIDPACGSGAFPMGMLQKLAHVLKKLDPENKGWRKRQEKAARAIESSTAREEAVKAIQRAFARDNDDYGRKLYLIENCLYGVDIQPIAVQISKLRFFVSLVCDQSIDSREENYGILPLPNLETKVVAANTLLGLHRGQLLLGSIEVKLLEDELKKVRHDYFTARSYRRKKELRMEDKQLRDKLAEALESSGEYSQFEARRLADWNPYDTNTHAQFFDPGWMFGLASKKQEGVFDIVIGNPPYVRQEELKNQTAVDSDGIVKPLKEVLKNQYECFTGTADLYVYFFERSLQLLRIGGILSFITSNKWFRSGYGEKLRTYLAYATRPSVVLDFGDAPVFTAIAYPAIIITQKVKQIDRRQLPNPSTPTGFLHPSNAPPKEWQSRVMTWVPGTAIVDFPEVFERESFPLAQSDLKPNGWRMDNPSGLRLLDRLRATGIPLGEYAQGRFYRGIVTGLNDAFVINEKTKIELMADESSAEIIKPWLRGRDIKRWRVEDPNLWLCYIGWDTPVRKYKAVYNHLLGYEEDLKARPEVKEGRVPWYAMSRFASDYWQEFSEHKVVIPAITGAMNFAPDANCFFVNNKASIFVPPSVLYSVSVCNSSVAYWFAKRVFASKQGGFFDCEPRYSSQLPIPSATSLQQALCERIAGGLIWLHSPESKKAAAPPTGLMIAYLEQWLNGLVYELFFPGELHARRLKLFEETAKLNPPDLAELRASDKLTALQELHERAYAKEATLRGMLFDLKSLDLVRVIEDVNAAPTGDTMPAEAEE